MLKARIAGWMPTVSPPELTCHLHRLTPIVAEDQAKALMNPSKDSSKKADRSGLSPPTPSMSPSHSWVMRMQGYFNTPTSVTSSRSPTPLPRIRPDDTEEDPPSGMCFVTQSFQSLLSSLEESTKIENKTLQTMGPDPDPVHSATSSLPSGSYDLQLISPPN